MKRISLLLSALMITLFSLAQTEKTAYPKTITVTGSAEIELVPDEIYVLVDLKEYEKKGQGKISIDQIRSEFLKKARALGLPDSAITIAQYDGYNGNPWLKKKKKEELMASITYQVKLRTSKQMDDLVAVLDDNATSNFRILRTTHSRIAEYRKQLKIQAVRAAREKAGYLTAAIDEKLGEAVTINEPVEYQPQPYYNLRASNMVMKEAGDADDVANADFTKIKLKYDVTVVFAIR